MFRFLDWVLNGIFVVLIVLIAHEAVGQESPMYNREPAPYAEPQTGEENPEGSYTPEEEPPLAEPPYVAPGQRRVQIILPWFRLDLQFEERRREW
jgi:hypothetical protein